MSKDLQFKGKIKKYKKEGKLASKYQPLFNLLKEDGRLSYFSTDKLNFDLNHEVDIETQDSYDGSVNLILNDDKNIPRLINSRFSVAEDSTYIIPDHDGNKDTNLYQEEDLNVDTFLQKTISRIPKITFNGLNLGGRLPCGMYHFYFTFCDNDGNETDFVGESSAVAVHIGNINDPYSIRMGMENETTDKCVMFNISNIDNSYDFVKVYYTRSTSGMEGQDISMTFEIIEKFPILNSDNTDVIIYGTEKTRNIDDSIINQQFEYCSKSKSQTICQNRLFLGNTWKQNIDYELLREASLLICPSIDQSSKNNIGIMDNNYVDLTSDTDRAFGYYNAKNIYYRTGYWPEEYYRFGVVYILNDFTLSPVFNVRGIDLIQFGENKEPSAEYTSYNDDGYLLKEDGKVDYTQNNFGVTRIPNKDLLTRNSKPIGVRFTVAKDDEKFGNKFQELKNYCKGFFIVRQDRIPITLAQGFVIGKTKDGYGNLPILQNDKKRYFTESFLNDSKSADGQNILESGWVYPKKENIELKAAIVPDAIIKERTFNSLFTSKQFKFNVYSSLLRTELESYVVRVANNKQKGFSYDLDSALFTMVNSGINSKSNGKDYFKAIAGEQNDIKSFESVINDWKKIGSYYPHGVSNTIGNDKYEENAKRINLKLSLEKLVRGIFGTYVGISDKTENRTNRNLEYGDVINIKDDSFNEDKEHYYIAEQIRKNSSGKYRAVSEREEITKLEKGITCFRGDCFICVYTHRMIRNFVDPDTPTSDNIIHPLSWNDNFLVQTNMKTHSEGQTTYVNEVIPVFKAKKRNGQTSVAYLQALTMLLLGIPTGKSVVDDWLDKEANNGISWDRESLDDMFICLPTDSKYSKLGQFGEQIGVPNTWYELGADKISRSDVNSVGLGHWITIRVLSNNNLCMRDIDFSNTQEEAVFGHKRSFYPLENASRSSSYKIPESNIINGANNNMLSMKHYWQLPDVPYTKQQYDTRIQFSEINVNTKYRNGFRIFKEGNFIDLPKTYGCLVDIQEWHGNIIAIMEHGVLKIAVNERSLVGSGDGGDIFINNQKVLSQTPVVISSTFGTTWKGSICITNNYIYGVDTYAKKIWRTDGNSTFECISDFKLQKFLNDNIGLFEWEKTVKAGLRNVKTHYNAFKKDVMFTFYNDNKEWNLCWNEFLQMFVTFYSWTPSFSENLDNIYISFNLEDTRNIVNDGTEIIDKYYNNAYDKDSVHLYIDDSTLTDRNCLIKFNSNIKLIEEDYNKYPDNIYFEIKQVDGHKGLFFKQLQQEDKDYIQSLENLNAFIEIEKEPSVFKRDNIIKLHISNNKFNKVHFWKHGQAGLYDGQGPIKPTTWYGKTYPYEFECVVAENAIIQKIFDNIMIISNKVLPEEIEYEIVGDSYDWYKYKDIINWINNKSKDNNTLKKMYEYILSNTLSTIKKRYPDFPYFDKDGNYMFRKLPYIRRVHDTKDKDYEDNATELRLHKDDLLNEERLNIRQKCNDIKKYGRLRGNIEYKEDQIKAEIRHINFKYAYINNGVLCFTKDCQSRIRDKYIRIRVRYSGNDLSVIQALKTLYTLSYS